VFGDGDGMLFNRLTIAIDIMGHELTHGVTQTEAQLIYQDQSGRSTSRSPTCTAPWSNTTTTANKLPRMPTG
jgi:hypothetical protein